MRQIDTTLACGSSLSSFGEGRQLNYNQISPEITLLTDWPNYQVFQ